MLVERLAAQAQQIELPRREVDRHRHDAPAVATPAHDGVERFFDRPAPLVGDEAGFFRQRDEAHRRHAPQGGVVPAHQGFGADDLARLQADFRLVDQAQLPGLGRIAQGGDEPFALVHGFFERGVEEGEARYVERWRHAQSEHGAAQEGCRGVAVLRRLREGSPAGKAQRVVVEFERREQRL